MITTELPELPPEILALHRQRMVRPHGGGWLLLLLAMVGTGLALFSKPGCSCNIEVMRNDLTAIQAGIRSMHPDGDYAALTTQKAVLAGVVPKKRVTGAGRVSHVHGGAMELRPFRMNEQGAHAGHFAIVLREVPPRACRKHVAGLRQVFQAIATDAGVAVDRTGLLGSAVAFDENRVKAMCAEKTTVTLYGA